MWYFWPVYRRKTKQCAIIMQIRIAQADTAATTDACRKFTLKRQAAPNRKSRLPRSFSRSLASLAPLISRSAWKR